MESRTLLALVCGEVSRTWGRIVRQLGHATLEQELPTHAQAGGPDVRGRDQRRVGGEHSAPDDALIGQSHEAEGVEGALDGMVFPTHPGKHFSHIDPLLFLIEDFVADKVPALKTIDLGLRPTRNGFSNTSRGIGIQ